MLGEAVDEWSDTATAAYELFAGAYEDWTGSTEERTKNGWTALTALLVSDFNFVTE